MNRVLASGRVRFAAVLAVSGALALTACGSSSSSNGGGGTNAVGSQATTQGQYGSLPAASTSKQTGGTITYPIENGSQPNYISPILPGANASVYTQQWQYLFYRPLFWSPVANKPIINSTLSIGNTPTYSDGGKTVTETLKPNYKWSDGHAVTANDVIFFVDEVKAAVKESAANFSNYTPGDFPDNIKSMSAPNATTVVFHLTKTYNPTFFTNTQLDLITPLPSTTWAKASASGSQLNYTNPANAKKIYNYLAAQAKSLSTYASNPLWQDVDGPFKLTSFNATTDGSTMVPNPTYGGPQKAAFSKLVFQYFASSTAEFNALRAGKLDVGGVPSADIPQVSALKRIGYNVFGYPDLGFYYQTFNFKDTTNNWDKVVGQLYIRQALAHLVDQPAIIKGVFHGAAAPAYGPVPPLPKTPYIPSNGGTNPYPYSPTAAKALLTAHGWNVVPNGTTTCQKPGTGTGECGAGIPKGQNLNITDYYTNDPPTAGLEVTQFAAAGKQVGVNITPVAKTFNYLIANYDDPSAPQNDNKWQMEDFGGFTEGLYPTTNEIFNTTGTYNEGGYSDSQADKLITASKTSSNPDAVAQEAQYLTQQLPGLFQANEDLVYAWKGISGPPDSFAALTQYGLTPEYWYLTK